MHDPNGLVTRWVPAARKGSLTSIALAFAGMCVFVVLVRLALS
ncbi:MAG: hypothetical protein RLT05_16220 [Bauldia litoralis]